MQILFNTNYQEKIVEPTFQSKKPMNAKAVMKSFEERVANPRSQLKDVDNLRLILQKLLKGFKVEFLAENFGYSLSKIYSFSADYNTHKIFIKDRDTIILNKLLEGVKREKIARDMDIDLRTVQLVADKNKAFERLRQKRDGIIAEKFKSGMLINDIAKMLGIDPVTVRRSLKRSNLK